MDKQQKTNFVQQGDVTILRVDSKPEGKVLDHLVLAEGEVTGHAHRVQGNAKLYEDRVNDLLLEVFPGGTTVTHEEHGNIDLSDGTYKIGIIQEYDHFAEEAREVRD